ncbi:Tad domain-containing protein [Tabrizicola sp. YIM 78059]|uniref:Tad domain-containing protein n=1 Tax=Tabrizicola sp. YIM 78059 TaxID=2529861 RepID=UPI00145A077C|nr:Tad domain-containing protein [Tabrizicola sp. YIM 78059]
MSYFFLLIFVLMIIFGGIAVDVMRFETRRVALQQTMDRAALAAASLTQTRTPREVVDDWFGKAGLGADLEMVRFSDPTTAAIADAGLRRVTVSARVRSYNFFMGIFSDNEYLESSTVSEATQGVNDIEVMLALDITGSMSESAGMKDDPKTPQNEASWSKIQALRSAATDFVNVVKENDSQNSVSIGLVPYNMQVNLPANLRAQFTVTNLSHWGGVANQGVPNINCIELPTSTYNQTALSRTTPMPMASVADTTGTTTNTTNFIDPTLSSNANVVRPDIRAGYRICTTLNDVPSTPFDESTYNHVMLPTKNGAAVINRIQQLQAAGNTYIVTGMRWATALIDETARPIYTAIGDASVQGRPADNSARETRKIIILMTDGDHVTSTRIVDAYKSGPSPIWRGADGRYAIRFWTGGPGLQGGTRPACAGSNTYFVPHLKPNSDTSCNSTSSAGRVAWLASPTWTGSGAVRQLDWSEVWLDLRLDYVVRQLYMRSNVSGTSNATTVRNVFRDTFYTNETTMDSLLQTNCTAARNAGIEIYGIAFNAPPEGQAAIRGCSSSPKESYYFNATDGDTLLAAFRAIATDISALRLTQ